MEKIVNGWAGKEEEGYNCFGCAPNNPFGLHMEFYRDDNGEVVSFWNPHANFQSWVDVLHGGIQSTMLDEIGGWTVNDEMDTCGVTTKMETKYIKPLLYSDGKMQVRAKMVKTVRNIAVVEAWIQNGKGEICTQATITYFTYPQVVAAEKFSYVPKALRNTPPTSPKERLKTKA